MRANYELKLGSDEKRIVWGEVYIPDVPDTDGEFMDAESIEKMAYSFMSNLRLKMIDAHHSNQEIKGAVVVESFVARKGDPDFIPGAWVVGVHVPDDDMWAKIKKGEINGFSMEALVTKTPVELEIELPPVLEGRTQMSRKSEDSEDHDHAFYVSYDEQGNFLGGKTSLDQGHFHPIKRGTVSEEVAGHRHRFAHVDIMKSVVVGSQPAVTKVDISGADLAVAGKKNPEGSGGRKKKRRGEGLAKYLRIESEVAKDSAASKKAWLTRRRNPGAGNVAGGLARADRELRGAKALVGKPVRTPEGRVGVAVGVDRHGQVVVELRNPLSATGRAGQRVTYHPSKVRPAKVKAPVAPPR